MPAFRPLPPSKLRREAPGGAAPEAIRIPVARAMVDCGVYRDGVRLPGKYTHAAALARVRSFDADGTPALR
jgi:magnesium transporter